MAAGPRRVLHLTADYGEYSQTFVADAMSELDARGWEGWLLTRSVKNRERFPFPPGERLIRIPARPAPARLAGVLAGRAPASWSARALRDVALRVRPSVVHAHFGWLPEDSVRMARAAGAPLVVSFYGADVSSWPRLAWWEAPRRVLGGARHRLESLFPAIAQALVPTPVVAEQLRALGYRGPVEVMSAGVRLEDFPLRPGTPAGPPRLLFVGRLIPRKGVDTLVRALPALRARVPGVELDVFGDGPERPGLERLAAELGVGGAVTFAGARTREQVRAGLERAHALVLPSRTMPDGEIETLGVVLLEALATGVPVVATRSGGIPSALPPEWRGELVPENDPSALAEAVTAAVTDPEREARARVGRVWVEREYSWRTLAARIEQAYELALAGSDGLAEAPPPGSLERQRGDV